jgi:hypothetical protein
MLKFTKRFQGSYFYTLPNGECFNLQSMEQYTGEIDKDEEGNMWVLTYSDDFNGDLTARAKSKKALVEYATVLIDNM